MPSSKLRRLSGFAHIEVIDSGADLNAYAMVENQSACCSPAVKSSTLPIAKSGCCGGGGDESSSSDTLHEQLGELLSRYNVNNYAASVKVYAVKSLRP